MVAAIREPLETEESRAFPFLPMKEVEGFLLDTEAENHTALMRSFHEWVRSAVAPKYRAWVRKAARSGKKK